MAVSRICTLIVVVRLIVPVWFDLRQLCNVLVEVKIILELGKLVVVVESSERGIENRTWLREGLRRVIPHLLVVEVRVYVEAIASAVLIAVQHVIASLLGHSVLASTVGLLCVASFGDLILVPENLSRALGSRALVIHDLRFEILVNCMLLLGLWALL